MKFDFLETFYIKDILSGKFEEKYFYSHRGAPFRENWLQSWKTVILQKQFPGLIMRWLGGTQKIF